MGVITMKLALVAKLTISQAWCEFTRSMNGADLGHSLIHKMAQHRLAELKEQDKQKGVVYE